MAERTIAPEEMKDYIPRIEAIASAWAYNEGNTYSRRKEHLDRLLDHAERGWITADWIDGAYHALLSGKHLEFSYDKKAKAHMWLAGKNREQVIKTLMAIEENGFSIKRKEI